MVTKSLHPGHFKPLLPFKCDRCKQMVTEESDLFRHRAAPGAVSVCRITYELKRAQNIVDTEGEEVSDGH